MRIWPARIAWFQAVAALLVGGLVAVGALVMAEAGPLAAVVGAAVGAAYFLFSMRRFLRRLRLSKRSLPEPLRETLRSCVGFYQKLDERGRDRFERDVTIFMSEQRVYGVRGEPVPAEAKVLVAASAAMLCHGMPDWEWPLQRDVIIYPSAFSQDYDLGHGQNVLGMVHHQGPIILSGPELHHDFCLERDGRNVGLHEMAHVMDMSDGRADGLPAGVAWVATAPWVELVADRLRKARSGRLRRVLRDYAKKNEAELFAVAVETFFEKPEQLAERDEELFAMLADYFNLDPRVARPLRPVDA